MRVIGTPLAAVAASGSYDDLEDTPTIPAAYSDDQARAAVGAAAYLASNALAVGESTLPRDIAQGVATAVSSGSVRLTFFTATKSETTTQVRVISGNTAAAPTPTVVRFGLYRVEGNGTLTLVASTANDTSLLSAANTPYTVPWQSSHPKVAGQRYAFAVLVVSPATLPNFVGQSLNSVGEMFAAPMLAGQLAGQSDLLGSAPGNGISGSGSRIYAAILP
jgi:hypothetical protein